MIATNDHPYEFLQKSTKSILTHHSLQKLTLAYEC